MGKIIDQAGNIRWYENGVLHRLNGPAVELASGTKQWWVNGKLHREFGAAVIYPDGNADWWVDGVFVKADIIEGYNVNPRSES